MIYKVPRRYSSLARVVDRARLEALPALPLTTDAQALMAYTARGRAASRFPGHRRLGRAGSDEDSRPAEQGADAPGTGDVRSGVARACGRTPRPVHQDPLDFSIIDVPTGKHDIAFVFETPCENGAGRVLTFLSLAAAAALIVARRPGPDRYA